MCAAYNEGREGALPEIDRPSPSKSRARCQRRTAAFFGMGWEPGRHGGAVGHVGLEVHGGTNFRAGLVELKLKKAKNLSGAQVRASDLWRHADDQPSRDKAVGRLADMLRALIERAA
jgi:hypothetical protein